MKEHIKQERKGQPTGREKDDDKKFYIDRTFNIPKNPFKMDFLGQRLFSTNRKWQNIDLRTMLEIKFDKKYNKSLI